MIPIAYIAAFLDCDGTVGIHRQKTKRNYVQYYPYLHFYSQNLAILGRMQATIGGTIINPCRSSGVFTLRVACGKAAKVASLLIPYLHIKRKQAEHIVEFQRLMDTAPRTHRKARLPIEHTAKREYLRSEIMRLNHVDPFEFRVVKASVLSGKPMPPSFVTAVIT